MSNAAPLEQEDWSFAKLSPAETLWGPHGYHRYPAKFIPQLVRRTIECFSEPGDLIGDVFLGSGTTGIEALRTKRRFYGSDINPVACFISQAKCTPINPQELEKSWQELEVAVKNAPCIERRQLNKREKQLIERIDISHASSEDRFRYWIPGRHRTSLEVILLAILGVSSPTIRTFYLCAFSNILRRCSTWLSGSTKPQKDLEKTLGNPPEEFTKQVRDMMKRNKLYWDDLLAIGLSPAKLFVPQRISLADARQLNFSTGALDLLVTSPPYATCYEYADLHQLTQLWFEHYGILAIRHGEQALIGSKMISSRENAGDVLSTGSRTANKALKRLEKVADEQGSKRADILREARALRCYFQDMQLAVKEMARVTKPGKRMVLIIGDSRRRNVDIPTTAALKEMALANGFTLERKIVRQVAGRVLVSKRDNETGRFSSTANSDTEVYPEENVLVFVRGGHATGG